MSITIYAVGCEVSKCGDGIQIDITGEERSQVITGFDIDDVVFAIGKDELLDVIGEQYAREYFGIED